MGPMKTTLARSVLLLVIASGFGCSAPLPTSSSGYLTLDNDEIYYELSGDGFPIVLVSGGSGMDLRQWGPVAQELDANYQVLRYDPRGIGKSDNPTTRYSDTADLVQLLDFLDLDRVGIIGLSSAGGFVLEFALQHPDRVAAVVAAAPFVPGFEFSEPMQNRLAIFSQAAQEGREPFLDSMFEDPHFIPAPLDTAVRETAREIMGVNFDKGAHFDPTLPTQLDPPLIDQLSIIESQVLLVVGELDHPEVLRRNQFLLEILPAAREQVVSQSGHNIPLENPAGFLEAISAFLLELAGGKASA